jgi:lysophospholipase L1-like esterase
MVMYSVLYRVLSGLVAFLFLSLPAAAQLPWQFDTHTRYMALGDSLAAGIGAISATQGYVYLLYQEGVFDTVPHTLFANAGVPGATSDDVLAHQVPQAIKAFRPTVITLDVGGNDLLAILNGADPAQVLTQFGANLTQILFGLRANLPGTPIYLSNLYSIPEIEGSDLVVQQFNKVVAEVAGAVPGGVPVADVYTAFKGRNGLLLVERHGADPLQVHPTNAGYRVMEQAFKAVINR